MDKKPKKLPRKISRQYLENAALYYLQRYATSAANLKRVMRRKIDRSCAFHNVPAADFYPLVDELIVRYTASGLLNDPAYAEAKTASLRRLGLSRQGILAKLQLKGLSPAEIETALLSIDEESGNENPELAAARTLARKKRLGPFRAQKTADPKKTLQKDFAALARAGFSYETARQVLQASEDSDDDF